MRPDRARWAATSPITAIHRSMMESLIHVIYASAATTTLAEHDLIEILTTARCRNASVGVTGMLLFSGGSFFQVLEGPSDAVDAIYNRIARDPRHGRLTTIIREPIAKRAFEAWTMGFSTMTSFELMTIVGTNDFFTTQLCFADLDEGRAKKLLAAFLDGRWRITLQGADRSRVRTGAHVTVG